MRAKRVQILKKIIIASILLGILIPTVLCILLFVRMNQMQRQIDSLTTEKEQKTEIQSQMKEAADGNTSVSINETRLETSDVETVVSEIPESTEEKGTKVYLTFDDGPSSNTEAILDILKQYNVKATFFVVGKPGEEYKELYNRIVEEGHTLGMHSYSHNYREIYDSQDAYKADLTKLQDFLYDTTGVWCNLYRFPGGSSNQVSKVDMMDLITYLNQQEITYFDWNISCGDATEHGIKADEIADNVIKQVPRYSTAVVLMHDAANKTSTVEALPIIIEELKQMPGLEFLPITEDTEKIQHIDSDKALDEREETEE